jgi:hypothetical protein
MPETPLMSKSVRVAADEAKWLSTAATRGAVTQNDLIRLALHRLRKELGAATRIKPETVLATAKASKYKLSPPRAAANNPPSAATGRSPVSPNGTHAKSKRTGGDRVKRTRAS